MANQAYTFAELRLLFYTLAGIQSDQDSQIQGEQTVAASVEDLIWAAEKKTAMMLCDPFIAGACPMMNVMTYELSWTQAVGGSTTQFQVPPTTSISHQFYRPISGYIKTTDEASGYASSFARSPLVFMQKEAEPQIRRNAYFYPGNGTYVHDFVPCYFEGQYLKFWIAPRGTTSTGQPNIFLTEYFLPPKPSGTYSMLPAPCKELVALLMLMDFYGIDGDDIDLAVRDVRMQDAAGLLGLISGNLGFNPFVSQEK